MEISEYWLNFKEVFKDLVSYGFPTIAIILSLLSYIDSRRAKKLQIKVIEIEAKLKQYELEKIEKTRKEETISCVEARIINISSGNYRIKVWNSGKATAYNVDFEVPDDAEAVVFKDKVPFEYLEPSKSFEENVIVHMQTKRKFNVRTTWSDENGQYQYKDQIVSI